MSINSTVFAYLNEHPDTARGDIALKALGITDKTVSNAKTARLAMRYWQQTEFKEYREKSTVAQPVAVATATCTDAAAAGFSELEARDLAIAEGVGHGTAFAVAAKVYTTHRAGGIDRLAFLRSVARQPLRTAATSGRTTTTTSKLKTVGDYDPDAVVAMAAAQGDRCALTGISFVFEAGHPYAPSVDRIDSDDTEYATDKVQLVTARANMAKGTTPDADFRQFIADVRNAAA